MHTHICTTINVLRKRYVPTKQEWNEEIHNKQEKLLEIKKH